MSSVFVIISYTVYSNTKEERREKRRRKTDLTGTTFALFAGWQGDRRNNYKQIVLARKDLFFLLFFIYYVRQFWKEGLYECPFL